jgi:hypothetical protein
MITTECPYCDEPQMIGWESGDPTGYFPNRCNKCQKVMWVEATSFGGETCSHEDFLKEICRPGDEEKVNTAAENATVQNCLEPAC